MKNIKKNILLVQTIILFVLFIFSLSMGRYSIKLDELFLILFGKQTGTSSTVIFSIRLPRIIAAVVVGASLSAAGSAYQGVFQNPMASPDILGASAGAGFGAALALLAGFNRVLVIISSFAFGLISVAIALFIVKNAKGTMVLRLVLSGIIVSSLFQSGTSIIKLTADPNNKLPAITYWLIGSLNGIKADALLYAFIPMFFGLAVLFSLRWKMNIMTMGDEEAQSLGVEPDKVRLIVILAATLITSAAVSISGMIGWVGLIIPHVMRRICGNDYRYLVPASMIGGGIFLLFADNISRCVSAAGIPIGILTSILGAPIFFYIITRHGE